MDEFEQKDFSVYDAASNKAPVKMISVDAELLGETGCKEVKSMPSEEYKAVIEKLFFK